jgi:exopolyphosphatase/guanosine-5'-triphosphate,3'-diphosphate pyrophosphatase
LARIVLAHRGKLERVRPAVEDVRDWLLIFALRIAALLHRARDDSAEPPVRSELAQRGFTLHVDSGWLAASPLTAAALAEEARHWSGLGLELRIKGHRSGA